ncbi:MAG: zinc protease [Candidatus Woesearchaeota archaeon]|jgi:zinc protease
MENLFKKMVNSHYNLSNGLPVLVAKTHQKSITLLFAVNVGSVHEAPEKRGISHFFEHMIFEGTEKRKCAFDISKDIETVGGEFNAMTSKTRTYFYVKVPSTSLELACDILSDCLLNATFKEDKIKKEKQVVLSEIDMALDDPKMKQWLLFEDIFFDTHPAKYPISGMKSHVKAFTKDDLVAHKNKWCVAKNAQLFVVGTIPGKTKSLLQKYFSTIPKGTKKVTSFPTEKNHIKQKKKTLKSIQQSHITVGYHIPNAGTKESAVCEVIESILSMGQSGWLFDEFRIKRGIAYDVRAMHESYHTGSLLAINVATTPKNTDLCKQLIAEQLKKLESVDTATVTRAKKHLVGRYHLEMEDTLDYALFLADQTLDDATTYLSQIKTVTKQEVIYFTKKYLQNPTTTILTG